MLNYIAFKVVSLLFFFSVLEVMES